MSKDKIAYVLELTEAEALFVRDVLSQVIAIHGHSDQIVRALNRAGLWKNWPAHIVERNMGLDFPAFAPAT